MLLLLLFDEDFFEDEEWARELLEVRDLRLATVRLCRWEAVAWEETRWPCRRAAVRVEAALPLGFDDLREAVLRLLPE